MRKQVGSLRAKPLHCMCYTRVEGGVANRTKNAGTELISLHSFCSFIMIVSFRSVGLAEMGVKLSCTAS